MKHARLFYFLLIMSGFSFSPAQADCSENMVVAAAAVAVTCCALYSLDQYYNSGIGFYNIKKGVVDDVVSLFDNSLFDRSRQRKEIRKCSTYLGGFFGELCNTLA